ncbi:MAG TPA: hypothetical protein DER64_08590 [Planctomycetaceae bacterium]|nr:hypothetical protein [Planctomycetaceae bacterium]
MTRVRCLSVPTTGLRAVWESTSTSRAAGGSSGLRFRCPEPTIVCHQAAQTADQVIGQLEMGVAR